MDAWAFRVLALFLLAAIIYYALRSYHHRELARIETAGLELEGFVKIALGAITFAWQCPKCGVPLLTREAVESHQSSTSACALVVEEEGAAVQYRAEQTGQAREDPWPALGAEEAPELEGAR